MEGEEEVGETDEVKRVFWRMMCESKESNDALIIICQL